MTVRNLFLAAALVVFVLMLASVTLGGVLMLPLGLAFLAAGLLING